MLRLGLVADVHMREADHAAVTDELESIVDRIAAFDPHRTVVLGDLVQDADPETDRRSLERALDALAPLEPRYLAGNHDVINLEESTLTDRFGNNLSGTETVGDVTLVYLDTSTPSGPRWRVEVGPDGRERLEDALATAETALVFAHHPLHYHDVTANPWFGSHPELAFPADKGWVTRILADHPATLATFNGHLHVPHHDPADAAHHFTLGAVNKERPDSTAPTGSYALVTLEDRLHVEVYDLDGFVRGWTVPV